MIMKRILAALLFLSQAAAFSQSLVAPGAKLEKLADGFSFTEGPTCDPQGNVFFTDQPNNRILEWSVDGKLSTFLQPAGRSNGMYEDAHGNLIACAEEHNELWSIAPDKTVTKLVTDYQGMALHGPNDVWVAPNGAIYLTDPFYGRTWTDSNRVKFTGEWVFYLSPDHKHLKPVIQDFRKPNGISGSPDGKKLFATDIGGNRTWRYDILPDGSLTNKSLICHQGCDGMTIDELGNFYLAGQGVTIYSPDGQLLEHLDVPEPWTANLSFSGPDHKTLFIAASERIYSIRLRVKGGNPAK
jgi:gluconolactonase